MNALIRKETRLLLPTWIGALVAATAPLWLWHELEGMVSTIFGAGIVALALSPFGLETSYGTLGLLLVQPKERRRFWRIKAGLLAVALVSAWGLFALCLWTRVWVNNDGWEVLKWSALMTVLAFSGGLWSTLLLRDMVSAFFCSCLIPALICVATLAAVGHDETAHDWFPSILAFVLAAYSAAGIFLARELFLNAQDVPWTGGQISLSSVRGMSLRWLAVELKGRTNRWAALVRKELQLQEVTMVLIPVLALLHLVVAVLCHFHPQWRESEQLFAAVPIIWLSAVPFVIGCVAVAEERRLNILESLLCLPMSKRASFTVKLAVALVLGIVLGGVIPWVLMRIGSVPLRGFEFQDAVVIAASITGIAFYASTMSRGLLQAVPTALCVATVMWLTLVLFFRFLYARNNFEFVRSSLFPALTWPAMISTFVWLAFNNYKRLQIGWRVWVGDFTRVGAVFGCAVLVSVAIFDRTWELFMQLEPRHGPTRLFGIGRACLGVSGPSVSVLLPDGRLWLGKLHYRLTNISGGFVEGSNWVQVAACSTNTFTMQSDGTLWRILSASDIRQIGSDSDWKKIDASGDVFVAVKQNGTLWGSPPKASKNSRVILSKQWPAKNDYDFVQIGDDFDWVNVFCLDDGQAIGIKRDGSAWKSVSTTRYEMALMVSPSGLATVTPPKSFPRLTMTGTNWSSIARFRNGTLGVRTDGSMWIVGNVYSKIFGEYVSLGSHPNPVRVGTKSDWVALSTQNRQFTALEANGTLWTMNFDQSKRPSKYTDWLAATQEEQFTWGLAKDGTLSCWDEFSTKGHLGPTRRPVFSGNILDAKQ